VSNFLVIEPFFSVFYISIKNGCFLRKKSNFMAVCHCVFGWMMADSVCEEASSNGLGVCCYPVYG